jgi:hypothetical protein
MTLNDEIEQLRIEPYKQDRQLLVKIKDMLEDNGFKSTFLDTTIFEPANLVFKKEESPITVKIFLSRELRGSLIFEGLKR